MLAAEVLALAAVRWPRAMSLQNFAHADPGAVLTLATLTAGGLRPGVDFVYIYGLATAAFGDLAFGAFGISPAVYAAACVVLGVGYAVALGWAAVGLGARGGVRAVVVAAVAVGMPVPAPNFVHLLEPIALSVAVGLYARGRPAAALAVVTAAVFVKPGLAFVFGLFLVAEAGWAASQSRGEFRKVLARRFLPALLTGGLLAGALAARYGPASVAATVLPGDARSVYEGEKTGFFAGSGRLFWNPPGAGLGYYLGTPAGGWLVATAVLVFGAAWAATRRAAGRGDDRPPERVVVACGVIHAAFVLVAFGGPYSWRYDYNLLTLGVVALLVRLDGWRSAVVCGGAVVVLALGASAALRADARLWRESVRTPGGLYAPPPVAAEWDRLTGLARTQHVFVLNYLGAAAVIDPELRNTPSWCLYWWIAPEVEIERTVAELKQAAVVAVPRQYGNDLRSIYPTRSPKIAAELLSFPLVEEWAEYRVFRRP